MTHETPNPETRFSSIWNHQDHPDQVEEMNKIANNLASPIQPDKKGTLKTKTWGFPSWVMSLLLLLLTQGAFTVYYVMNINSNLLELAKDPVYAVISASLMYSVWIGWMFYTSYVKGQKSIVKDFNLKFKPKDILYGLGLAAIMYALVYGSQYVLHDIFGLNLDGANNGAALFQYSGAWLWVFLFIGGVLGPFCEELWFRGHLLQGIIKSADNQKERFTRLRLTKKSAPVRWYLVQFLQKIKLGLALVVSSTIFGLFHYQGEGDNFGYIYIMIATGTLGLGLGAAYLIFRRLGPSIFAHIIYNSANIILALIFSASI